ncbi:MAG: UbiA family prenyltransferase [Candidatus Micrarchaeia archaeon]
MLNLKSWLKLTRIEHSLMLSIAVITAELLSGSITLDIILLSLVAPWLISMGAFAINDYYDVDADRANKRLDRPLVNGSISKDSAFKASIIFFVVGTAFSVFNIYAFLIAAIFAVLAFLYSYKLKDTILIGNIYIAFTMVIPFIYGAEVAAESINTNIILLSLLIFLAGLAREIHGMIRDYIGDKKARKSNNLIAHIGEKSSSIIAFILYLEAIIISIYLFFYSEPFLYNFIFLFLILITDIMLIYVSIIYIKGLEDKYKQSRNISLAAMSLALIAFFLAVI